MSREDEDLLMPLIIGHQPQPVHILGKCYSTGWRCRARCNPTHWQHLDVNSINTSLKICLYMSIVLPMAICACETWKNTVRIGHKLDVFHQRCLRCILRVTYHDTKEEILRRAKTHRLSSIVSKRHIKVAGHVLRQPEQCPQKIALTWMPPNGRRRPKKTWRSTFKEHLKWVGVIWEEAESHAAAISGICLMPNVPCSTEGPRRRE